MDYEKKYKEALKRARIWQNHLYKTNDKDYADELNYIFPELKESEDERIRKSIHIYLDWLDGRKDYAPRGEYTIRDMISWLEKQGEQKPADNGEPKFKVGEWITHNTANFVFKIINVGSNGYEVVNRENYKKTISFDNVDNYHLWTIKDAKDGDVLVDSLSGDNQIIILFKCIELDTSIRAHCGWDGYNFRVTTDGTGYGTLSSTKYVPATKEKRDTLFAKMHEAGYMWDSESKQLLFLKAEPRYT